MNSPPFKTASQLAGWLAVHAKTFLREDRERVPDPTNPQYVDGLHDAYASAASFVRSFAAQSDAELERLRSMYRNACAELARANAELVSLKAGPKS